MYSLSFYNPTANHFSDALAAQKLLLLLSTRGTMGIDFSCTLHEDQLIVIAGQRTLTTARFYVFGCESCDNNVEIPFEWVLDMVTGADPALTSYIVEEPLSCPCCGAPITEKTLVTLE